MESKTKEMVFSFALVITGIYVAIEGFRIYLRAASAPYFITTFSISPGFIPFIIGIALIIFRERIGKLLWAAIVLIIISSALLSFEDMSAFSFSIGSIFVILACTCWGLENNCTRMISGKSPEEIVIIKGFGSGIGALIVALMLNVPFPSLSTIPLILLLGFASYGLSVFFYVYAQRYLGAARTSAYYALSPFIGSFLSFIILKEQPTLLYGIALAVMIAGTILVTMDSASE